MSYGVDLRRALWGPPRERIGARRLRAFIHALPLGSAFARTLQSEPETKRIEPVTSFRLDPARNLAIAQRYRRPARGGGD